MDQRLWNRFALAAAVLRGRPVMFGVTVVDGSVSADRPILLGEATMIRNAISPGVTFPGAEKIRSTPQSG